MRQEHVAKLLGVARANPAVYGDLLRDPRGTAAALGIELDRADLAALRQDAARIQATAREHDELQGEIGKSCLFMPVLASVPSKRKRKAPKPPKPRKLS
jgi:hypothetical protein